jgi:hypothetical protein
MFVVLDVSFVLDLNTCYELNFFFTTRTLRWCQIVIGVKDDAWTFAPPSFAGNNLRVHQNEKSLLASSLAEESKPSMVVQLLTEVPRNATVSFTKQCCVIDEMSGLQTIGSPTVGYGRHCFIPQLFPTGL